jgi:hypothetical protein
VIAGVPITAAGLVLVGILGAAPAHADPVVTYGSNGVFGVGAAPKAGWSTASIPPGHYRVDQSPSMYPYQSPPGSWLRCNDFPCAGNFPEHIIASGEALRDQPTFVDILPTDVAVSLNNVTLTVS